MLGPDAGDGPVALVADPLGQVLLQRSTDCDVQHLHSAADAEQRQIARERPQGEGDLETIAVRVRAADLRMGLLAVAGRVDVGAAPEDQRIEAVEQLVGRSAAVGSGGIIIAIPPAAWIEWAYESGSENRWLLRPYAVGGGLDRGADADQGRGMPGT